MLGKLICFFKGHDWDIEKYHADCEKYYLKYKGFTGHPLDFLYVPSGLMMHCLRCECIKIVNTKEML